MPLTHVQMLSERNTWEDISITEACVLFPHVGVAARSGLFRCSLCGQYVTFAKGKVYRPYFKHTQEDQSSDCPDRSESRPFIATASTLRPGAQILPLRLSLLYSNIFKLELGLPPVPKELLDKQIGESIYIRANDDASNSVQYLLSRISENQLTYLPLGEFPSESYTLSVGFNYSPIMQFWPREINGVSRTGTLFDGDTRKMIPFDSDVQVNHLYYLVTTKHYVHGSGQLHIEQKCRYSTGWFSWFVYAVRADSIDESTIRFFMEYHCRLTETPLTIVPLWPAYTKSPYVIYHNTKQMFMYIKGNAKSEIFPYGERLLMTGCNGGHILSVYGSARQQLLSIGRARVLQSTYLWFQNLDYEVAEAVVNVTDINGEQIAAGDLNSIPQKKRIKISVPYDGEVKIYQNDVLRDILPIVPGNDLVLDNIWFGMRIEVYQGLDRIWHIAFRRSRDKTKQSDIELYNKLAHARGNLTTVGHSVGAIAKNMQNYPLTRQWLRKQITKGSISVEALQLIEKEFLKRD